MQTNVKTGDFVVLAGEDLIGKEDYLVKLTHDTGVPEVLLPTITPTSPSTFCWRVRTMRRTCRRPLEAGRSMRFKLKGTCNPATPWSWRMSEPKLTRERSGFAGHARHVSRYRHCRRGGCVDTQLVADVPRCWGTSPFRHKESIMKKLITIAAVALLGVTALAVDPDFASREAWRTLVDTNATTSVTLHTATHAGQMLVGKVGGSNAVWIATDAGTNGWIKAVQAP
jgi:hypothetical protein